MIKNSIESFNKELKTETQKRIDIIEQNAIACFKQGLGLDCNPFSIDDHFYLIWKSAWNKENSKIANSFG